LGIERDSTGIAFGHIDQVNLVVAVVFLAPFKPIEKTDQSR
jgi:hypothetical protein